MAGAHVKFGGLEGMTGILAGMAWGAILSSLLVCGCQKKAPAGGARILSIVTASGVEMVLLPGGDFIMGDARGEQDERPPHRVHVSSFYMDKHEVTQKAHEGLMGANPSKFRGPDLPVERVSWLAAIKYCNARSLKEGLTPCYDLETLACDFAAGGYRLPTEAEWEYACRAGGEAAYSFGPDAAMLPEFGWFKANSAGATHAAGLKKPNDWGLRDMHGNAAEWCNDSYGEGYYSVSDATDPRGPQGGEKRVIRGGSWRSDPQGCRSPSRLGEAPGFADMCFGYEAYGFRCVRKAVAQPQ